MSQKSTSKCFSEMLRSVRIADGCYCCEGLCVTVNKLLFVVVAMMGGEEEVRVTERRDVTRTGSVADARPFLAV